MHWCINSHDHITFAIFYAMLQIIAGAGAFAVDRYPDRFVYLGTRAMDVEKVLHYLQKEDVVLTHEDRDPDIRSMKKSRLIKMIERSEKFSFDSSCVQGMDNIVAINETAGEMIEFGLFHLPYSQIFIEDKRSIQNDQTNYYMCKEIENDRIIIYCLCSSEHPVLPWLTVISRPTEISLKNGRISVGTVGEEISALKSPYHEIVLRMWMEATVAIRTFIVILATEQQRAIRGMSRVYTKSPTQKNLRSHAYTTILPPNIESLLPEVSNDARRRPRLHLVRGYIWGRNRPPHEQRWIKPYFRGMRVGAISNRKNYRFSPMNIP